MSVTALNLSEYFFLLVFNVETVLSVCDVKVRTIDLGCYLEWDCPDANPKTTYTVQTKTFSTSWRNVSDCVQISRQSCDLKHVFSNIEEYNFISLRSEELPGLNERLICEPMNDFAATFTPPNLIISMDNGSVWVTVNFPCAPSKSCIRDDEEEKEIVCPCTINYFKNLLVTVTLYNKQNLSDRQSHTAAVAVMEGDSLKVEFGFLTPGQVYCAVANFTAEGVLAPSPTSVPQCVYKSATIDSLVVTIVCPVLVALGLVIFLLWRHCRSSERPLPRSLALLRDLELQKQSFIDSGKAAPENGSSEGDQVSVVSICEFTLMDNHAHSYHNLQNLGNEYYTSPILHDPDYVEESVELGALDIEIQNNDSHLFPSYPILEAKEGCPCQNYCEKTLNIPLSSVQVKCTQQDEMSTDDPERYDDVEIFKTEYKADKQASEQIQITDVSSQMAEYI